MADFRLTRGSLLLALLAMTALTPTALGNCSSKVGLVAPEDRSSSRTLTLSCPGIDVSHYAIFYRCEDDKRIWINPYLAGCTTGPRPECLNPDRLHVANITVEVTPQTEGGYYCVPTRRDETSIECTEGCSGTVADMLEITAFPMKDADIAVVEEVAAWTGSFPLLECEFPEGRLSDRYTYKWFKDGSEFTVGGSINGVDNRYQAVDGNRLQIRDVSADDEGSYHCQVDVVNTVSSNMQAFPGVERGRSIKLGVYTNVTVQPFASQVAREGAQVDFTCVTTGIPQPSVQWLFAGQRVDDDDFGGIKVTNTNNEDTFEVTSVVTISRALSQMHNILVTCVANQTGTIVALPPAQETASLTVMPNPVTGVVLSLSTVYPQRVFLRFDIPDPFLGMVGMEVMYLVDGTPRKVVHMLDESLDKFSGGVAILELPRDDWLEIKDEEFQVIVKMTSMDLKLKSDASAASNPILPSTGDPTSSPIVATDEIFEKNINITVIVGLGVVVFVLVALCFGCACICCQIHRLKKAETVAESPTANDTEPPTAPSCHVYVHSCAGAPPFVREDGDGEDPWQAEVIVEEMEDQLVAINDSVVVAWEEVGVSWQAEAVVGVVDEGLVAYLKETSEATNENVETDRCTGAGMVNSIFGANGRQTQDTEEEEEEETSWIKRCCGRQRRRSHVSLQMDPDPEAEALSSGSCEHARTTSTL